MTLRLIRRGAWARRGGGEDSVADAEHLDSGVPPDGWSALLRYGVAVGGVGLAALSQGLLARWIGEDLHFVLFYPAVVAAACVGGLGAGLLATALAVVAESLLVMGQGRRLPVDNLAWDVRLIVFVVVGVFISLAGKLVDVARRRWMAEARRSRTAEAALRESESRFHSIFNQAAIGLCLATPEGKMLVVNRKLCELLGYTPEELVKKTHEEITYTEDWPAQVALAKRLVAGEIDSYTMEKRYIRKDGSLVWAQLTCSAVRLERLYVVVIVEDINARKRAEDELRRAQERYSALFDRSMDCVYLLDFEGRFIDANPAALELLGYTREEIPSVNIAMLVDPEQLALAKRRVEEVRTTGHTNKPAEFKLTRKDGQSVFVETKTSIVFHDGRPVAMQGIGRDITDRRRAEEALRESEEKFRSLAENMHAAVGMVQGARFVYANRHMAEMLGYTVEEILELDFPKLVHPQDRERMIDRARRRQMGEPVQSNYEFMALTKGGETRWMDFSVGRTIYRGRPAIIGTGIDITERKQAEERLRSYMRGFKLLAASATRLLSTDRPREVLREVFEELADHLGVNAYIHYLMDEDGRRLRMYSQRGLAAEVVKQLEVVDFGQTLCGTVALQKRPIVVRNVQQSSEPKAMMLHPLGIRAYACHPLLGQSGLIGTLSFCADDRDDFNDDELELMRIISHQAAMALERQRLAEELEQRAKELAEANRAKDHFMAVLSHELRTPLTPVLAAASILEKDRRLPPDVREDVEMIRRNVDLEARLIDDLLDLTRISRGKLELRLQLVEACVLLRHTAEMCSADLDAKGLHFGAEMPGKGLWLWADPARLQQVFWNLLNNAVKFTPHGGCVGVRCSGRELGKVVVEVVDSGVGVEPEVLPRIFNAFEQGGRVVTRQFGGLGLGLAISKALVELHGGRIEVESAGKGKGATFRVVLPAATMPPEQARPSQGAPSEDHGREMRKGKRILLVEDHRDTARMVSQLLKAEGHQVEVAGTVAEAVGTAERGEFDLIISDLGLPDGSGLDVMRHLRANGRACKGIAVSGYGMDEDVARSREAGFAEHLTKPIKLDHLERVIERVMAR